MENLYDHGFCSKGENQGLQASYTHDEMGQMKIY
jgi:hypothetical protein